MFFAVRRRYDWAQSKCGYNAWCQPVGITSAYRLCIFWRNYHHRRQRSGNFYAPFLQRVSSHSRRWGERSLHGRGKCIRQCLRFMCSPFSLSSSFIPHRFYCLRPVYCRYSRCVKRAASSCFASCTHQTVWAYEASQVRIPPFNYQRRTITCDLLIDDDMDFGVATSHVRVEEIRLIKSCLRLRRLPDFRGRPFHMNIHQLGMTAKSFFRLRHRIQIARKHDMVNPIYFRRTLPDQSHTTRQSILSSIRPQRVRSGWIVSRKYNSLSACWLVLEPVFHAQLNGLVWRRVGDVACEKRLTVREHIYASLSVCSMRARRKPNFQQKIELSCEWCFHRFEHWRFEIDWVFEVLYRGKARTPFAAILDVVLSIPIHFVHSKRAKSYILFACIERFIRFSCRIHLEMW